MNHEGGSYFFLAALLTDLALDYDAAFTADHCGTCRACLDACPTNAFPQPYVLDATRCISYLTIELRDHIPRELRPGIGDWLFGCDICQDVCPWNQRAVGWDKATPVAAGPPEASSVPGSSLGPHYPEAPASSATTNFEPGTLNSPIELLPLFDLDDDAFRARFRHTPLWRARRRGILRNAAIILGNQFRALDTLARSASEGNAALAAVTATLIRALGDPEPLIRAASAWALSQINTAEALDAMNERRTIETDPAVLNELQLTTDTHNSAF